MDTHPSGFQKLETIVILCMMVAGFVLGIIFYYDDQPAISAVMFAIALASLIYRFLGGIGDQNSFTLGAVKFGGSAAVIFGFMYGINTFIFSIPGVEVHAPIRVQPASGWVPVDLQTGRAVRVQISQSDSLLYEVAANAAWRSKRKTNELELAPGPDTNEYYAIGEANGDTVGYTSLDQLAVDDLYRSLSLSTDRDAYRFVLYPDKEPRSSKSIEEIKELPFEVRLQNRARYRVFLGSKTKPVASKVIVPRTGTLLEVPGSNEVYIVFIEQANSLEDNVPDFTRWIVIPLKKHL